MDIRHITLTTPSSLEIGCYLRERLKRGKIDYIKTKLKIYFSDKHVRNDVLTFQGSTFSNAARPGKITLQNYN